ncbi:hypothetical protein KRX19_02420 [Cardiobacteriaceae bacterium TAE3-ERU3]|nr:hypothetical protein [Cardiobacteriaceae bacterium TAE3-ERU3]
MIEQQVKILNDIVHEIHRQSEAEYDSFRFEYKFNPDEEWSQYGVYFIRNGLEALSQNMDYDEITRNCEKLHAEIQAHAGGDWRKFVLTLDENMEVKTKFIYEVQSCMDDFAE